MSVDTLINELLLMASDNEDIYLQHTIEQLKQEVEKLMNTKNNNIFDIDNVVINEPKNNDDFYFTYDSYEDIQKCLVCEKEYCILQ